MIVAICHVWAWIAGERDGTPVIERVLASGPGATRPAGVPDSAWLAEQDAEAWWDEIVASGRGRRWLAGLAALIADGRVAQWSVSPRQLRQALRQAGLRDHVEALVAATGGDLLDWWEYSLEYDRHHPLIDIMRLGLSAAAGRAVTADDVDAVWLTAEAL